MYIFATGASRVSLFEGQTQILVESRRLQIKTLVIPGVGESVGHN
jgi:hypothetical protein